MITVTIQGKTKEELQTNLQTALSWWASTDTTTDTDTDTDTDTTEDTGYSFEDDVLPAMKAYAKRHGREEALKVLAKFHAKSSKEVDEKDYPALMKKIA